MDPEGLLEPSAQPWGCIHPALVASPVWQHLLRCWDRRLAPQRPGERAGLVLSTSANPKSQPGDAQLDQELPWILELPLARCCILSVISGALGGQRGAAGSSAAPKSGSPTFRFVPLFRSSILQLKSLCFIKYFSILLNILQLIPSSWFSRHRDRHTDTVPGGQMSPGPCMKTKVFHPEAPRGGQALLWGREPVRTPGDTSHWTRLCKAPSESSLFTTFLVFDLQYMKAFV